MVNNDTLRNHNLCEMLCEQARQDMLCQQLVHPVRHGVA